MAADAANRILTVDPIMGGLRGSCNERAYKRSREKSRLIRMTARRVKGHEICPVPEIQAATTNGPEQPRLDRMTRSVSPRSLQHEPCSSTDRLHVRGTEALASSVQHSLAVVCLGSGAAGGRTAGRCAERATTWRGRGQGAGVVSGRCWHKAGGGRGPWHPERWQHSWAAMFSRRPGFPVATAQRRTARTQTAGRWGAS